MRLEIVLKICHHERSGAISAEKDTAIPRCNVHESLDRHEQEIVSGVFEEVIVSKFHIDLVDCTKL